MGAGRGCIPGNLLQNTTLLHVRAARLCHFNESSCGATFIAMMQTTNLREDNNLTSCWRVYWMRAPGDCDHLFQLIATRRSN
jgi:hypothetical protein